MSSTNFKLNEKVPFRVIDTNVSNPVVFKNEKRPLGTTYAVNATEKTNSLKNNMVNYRKFEIVSRPIMGEEKKENRSALESKTKGFSCTIGGNQAPKNAAKPGFPFDGKLTEFTLTAKGVQGTAIKEMDNGNKLHFEYKDGQSKYLGISIFKDVD